MVVRRPFVFCIYSWGLYIAESGEREEWVFLIFYRVKELSNGDAWLSIREAETLVGISSKVQREGKKKPRLNLDLLFFSINASPT